MKQCSSKKLLSFLLAFVLAVTPVLSGMPPIQAKAAGEQWTLVKAGDQNGNSHSYEDAEADPAPAAVLLHQSAKMPLNKGMSAKIRFTNENPAENAKFGMFYTYQDATHWIYIGYDSDSKWYYQYQNGEDGDYASLKFSSTDESCGCNWRTGKVWIPRRKRQRCDRIYVP